MSERFVLNFRDYGPAEYELFLKAKAVPEFELVLNDAGIACGISMPSRFAHMLGERDARARQKWQPLPGFMFPDQKAIVTMALDAERFACWSDCGLGKTVIELEFARQVVLATHGKVLIFTLPEVVDEIAAQGRMFYENLPVEILKTREEMRKWCAQVGPGIGLTNYEKMNHEDGDQIVREMKLLAGIVLDESSRLKTGGGKQKWALVKSAKGIRYKLSCTATPAPNEVMEFASQAAFLERIRGENEVMWTYFTRDPQTQEWTVKRHARPHFFRWMASWSIYVRDPAAYGWNRNVAAVPEPQFIEHRIAATAEQRELAFACAASESSAATAQDDMFVQRSLGMVGRNALSQIAKGFRYTGKGEKSVQRYESKKPGYVAQLIASEAALGPVLVWCIFDAEVDILAEELSRLGVSFGTLGGTTAKSKRGAKIEDFTSGCVKVLVSKAAMLGFGRNFQMCASMVFNGYTDSFEMFYQAVRRAYRFGQTKRLRVHLPYIPELEEPQLRNVLRKASQFEQLIREQESAYVAARSGLLSAA